MKRVNLVRCAALLLTIAASCKVVRADEANRLVSPKVVFGQNNATCRAVVKVIRTAKKKDFWGGQWRDHFGSLDWIDDTDPTIPAEGRPSIIRFKYANIDINNDGRRDIVAVYSGSFRYVDWDWLYLFDPEKFGAAQKQRGFEKLTQEVPQLNPGNVVQFTNGQSGLPVELHLWHYKGATFLLAKEYLFAKKKPATPSSFFVAKLGPQSAKWDEVNKVRRLVPELTCRMIAK